MKRIKISKATSVFSNTKAFEKGSPNPKPHRTPDQSFDKVIARMHVSSIDDIIDSIRHDLTVGIGADDKEMAINLLTISKRILLKKSDDSTEDKEAPAKYRRYICIPIIIEDELIEYKWHLIDYTNELSSADLKIQGRSFVYSPNGLPIPSRETSNKVYIVDNKLMGSK